MDSQEIKPRGPQDEHIVENKELNIWEALIPVIALVIMLFFNVKYVFGDDALSGSNQFIMLIGAAIAVIVGMLNKVSFAQMMEEIAENIKSTIGAILIILFVGALAGTWLISGIIPTIVYYGLQILSPSIFLPACVIICALISIATGSSWATSATVGIALVGIGNALGIDSGMTAGAVISGAYFGDKMSPLSDTTNLAPAMAGGELFSHIKYMTYTTIPTIVLTLIIFIIISLSIDVSGTTDTSGMITAIEESINITPWVFLVPCAVIFMIIKKTPPLIALFIGALLGGIFAIIFQPDIVKQVAGSEELNFISAYKGIMTSITVDSSISTSSEQLNELFSSGGMAGMLGTIWLVICAMVFGGVMDAIGALSRISKSVLSLFDSIFGLFASTVISCVGLNAIASDQYLAIVIPGRMYKKAFEDKGLAPENLSRTLEDSGTVTSVLVPWNTCGAYQSGVLGVDTFSYAGYAFFNWLSPFTTLLFAAFSIKIKQLTSK
ncbi:Na+/H+ antiporter NhaC [Thalassobellus sediminis]|uniref:Na+/H+ antiporter NhaC n=1 Tax=Thalassobellus sediminis TaxID=3367753 RepID=UPI0037A98CCA